MDAIVFAAGKGSQGSRLAPRAQKRALEQMIDHAIQAAAARWRRLGGIKPLDDMAAMAGRERLKCLPHLRMVLQTGAQIGG